VSWSIHVREQKKELVGRVVGDKMQKTVVVAVMSLRRHRLYQRTMRRTKKYMAHDAQDACQVGDLVRIQEARPVSRHKHWRVIDILEAAADRGRAVDMPKVGLAGGVPDVAAVADADVVPGVLPGTSAEDESGSSGVERGAASGGLQ
jgi:small subunit ribosomal protein S17